MNTKKISFIILLASSALIYSSCKKSFYTSANTNTNAPSSVTPSTLLSTVEGSLGYTIGGDMSRFACTFVQQVSGVGNQAAAWNQYIFTGQDVDNLWGDMYTSVMENDIALMQNADAHGYNTYSGIARILMAYSLQMTVDCWGSIPYSHAFQGLMNKQPAYDNDKALYATIQTLCDSGIIYLNNTFPGYLVPGSEDELYGGSATQWIKFAHAIKARLYIHQSKGNASMASSALSEIAQSFTSNADNAVFAFGSASTNYNSWYQTVQVRTGYYSFVTSDGISIPSLMYTSLTSNSDPRFNFILDTSTKGGASGDNLGAYYGSANSVTEFITYDELQFMTAEATITSGGSLAAAKTAYQNGITASMTKLGVSTSAITTYLASHGTLTASNAMSKIGYEEWVASYLNPEEWATWRRLGYPSLTPTSGSNIPRRLLYPQTEYSDNKANTPASTLYTPLIFWD